MRLFHEHTLALVALAPVLAAAAPLDAPITQAPTTHLHSGVVHIDARSGCDGTGTGSADRPLRTVGEWQRRVAGGSGNTTGLSFGPGIHPVAQTLRITQSSPTPFVVSLHHENHLPPPQKLIPGRATHVEGALLVPQERFSSARTLACLHYTHLPHRSCNPQVMHHEMHHVHSCWARNRRFQGQAKG